MSLEPPPWVDLRDEYGLYRIRSSEYPKEHHSSRREISDKFFLKYRVCHSCERCVARTRYCGNCGVPLRWSSLLDWVDPYVIAKVDKVKSNAKTSCAGLKITGKRSTINENGDKDIVRSCGHCNEVVNYANVWNRFCPNCGYLLASTTSSLRKYRTLVRAGPHNEKRDFREIRAACPPREPYQRQQGPVGPEYMLGDIRDSLEIRSRPLRLKVVRRSPSCHITPPSSITQRHVTHPGIPRSQEPMSASSAGGCTISESPCEHRAPLPDSFWGDSSDDEVGPTSSNASPTRRVVNKATDVFKSFSTTKRFILQSPSRWRTTSEDSSDPTSEPSSKGSNPARRALSMIRDLRDNLKKTSEEGAFYPSVANRARVDSMIKFKRLRGK